MDNKNADYRLDPIPQLWQAVTNQLRMMILSGELPARAHLVEVDLARRLGVSRGPIRQALARLEQEGSVEVLPRQGAFVREITPQSIQEKYELRRLLEGYAVRLAARRCQPADVKVLQKHCDEIQQSVEKHNLELFYLSQYNLHRAIVAMSGMEMLLRLWDLLGMGIGSLMMLNLYYAQRDDGSNPDRWHSRTATESVSGHCELVTVIASGDEERAAQLMVHHLQVGESSVLASLEAARQAALATSSEMETVAAN